MALLVEEFPELTLTFIGKPNPDGPTDQRLEAKGLKSRMEFHHGIGAAEIVDLYAQASIAVVPSEYEGLVSLQLRPWPVRSRWYRPLEAPCRSGRRRRHHSAVQKRRSTCRGNSYPAQR